MQLCAWICIYSEHNIKIASQVEMFEQRYVQAT